MLAPNNWHIVKRTINNTLKSTIKPFKSSARHHTHTYSFTTKIYCHTSLLQFSNGKCGAKIFIQRDKNIDGQINVGAVKGVAPYFITLWCKCRTPTTIKRKTITRPCRSLINCKTIEFSFSLIRALREKPEMNNVAWGQLPGRDKLIVQ